MTKARKPRKLLNKHGYKNVTVMNSLDALVVGNRPLAETIMAWNPETKEFFTYPWSDNRPNEKLDGLPLTAGAVYADWREATPEARMNMLLAEIVTIMVRDGLPFTKIHNELHFCPEYRALFPEDVA